MFSESPIKRRKSTRINVGNVPIGDGAPIAVQSMTNTSTTDVDATVAQIKRIEAVGGEIVRVSVPTMDAAEAFKLIKQQVDVPLIADIHFDYRIALKVAEYGVDCLRINPGNIGNEELISTIVVMAHNLNLRVVAEGVETLEQLQFLQDLACEYIQGYYFSKPVDANTIVKLTHQGVAPSNELEAKVI